ncbi:MAG TPA: right-handed parallel beta-helix repeat-containing protein, partial [Candidatus Dormibacteraeota bacterium]
MSGPSTNLLLRHGWKLGFAVLALVLLTARGATQQGPVQLHQRALAVASDGPTIISCGALKPDTAGGTTTTWTAAHSPYILPLNTTNDPIQPSSACPSFPLPGQAATTPTPGVVVNPGSTLVIDASLGPVQIFSHGAGITVYGGSIRTVGTGSQNFVSFDAEPDVASWDGLQIVASDAANRGNASLGYTSIGHALTSITITSGATSTIDPSGRLDASGNPALIPYGLALYKSAIGPSYFDGIDVTDTPASFIGEKNTANSPPLADGLFGTVNNIGSQGIKLTYDGAAPAGSAGVDIEATAFGSSVPFGDTTCLPLSPCAAGTIGNDAIQASFAGSPSVPFTLKNNRFYRAGSFGIELNGVNDPLIATNLFDCNGSGTPKPSVTPCSGGGLKYSAIYLNGATVDLENRVTGNTGGENGLDAIVFNGTVTSSTFTWKNATNAQNATRPLGYLINGGMTMNGGTFNVPGGSFVKVKDGSITLNNATLDASDSGAKVFTSLRDNANIASCPTVFVQSCPNPLPAGEWSGIDVVGPPTATTPNTAAVRINNATVLYPTTGVSAQGAHAVSIASSTIGPTFADGVTAVNTPVTVSATTFGCAAGICSAPAIGHQGINADYTTAGGTLLGALTVTADTFQGSVDEAIVGTGLAGQPVDIETNTIRNAGSFGINLQGADHLTLQNNAISNSGVASPTHSAIYLNGVSNADFGSLISGNTGTGNGLNAIVFHGATSTALTWQTVGLASATSANPLGYMLDGDLTVNGGLTLNTTDPSGDYVPVLNNGKITVKGGPVTGVNATFTSFKEHSRLPTCGTVFVPKASGACQAPAAGDWGGLVPAANQSNSLIGGEIRYATTGISMGNPGTALGADNLRLTNTNIRNTVSDGVHSLSAVSISGGSFTNNGGSAINVDLTAGGVVTGRSLDIENASISRSGSDGIVGLSLAGQSTTIKSVVVDHSGGYGIDLVGPDHLTLKNNVVTNAATGFAAIYLNGYDGDFSSNITGNTGAGNGLDALVFHGTVTGDLAWLTARKTSDPTRPLGYLLDNSLSMPTSGTTLTVNAGDVVKVGNGGTLLLQGVTMRADNTGTSAQKIFTSLADNAAGVAACPSQLLPGCKAANPGDWGGINLSGAAANGALINAAVRYAGTGISITGSTAHSPTSSSFALVVARSSISSSLGDAVDALNTSLSVTDSTITGAVNGINANVVGSGVTAYLRLSGNRFMSTSAEAILGQALAGQPVWITDNHVQDAATFGIRLVDANALVLRNNNVSCSGLGAVTGCTAATAAPYPAIYLDGVSADFANNVRGNVGSNNGMDVLAFHGDVNSDLNWLTPTVNATTHRLGYLLNGAVRVNDGTLKIHAGDIVKSLGGPITIRGGVLDASDASAGTKLFTSLKDTSAYPVTCPSVFTGLCSSTSVQPGDWGGLVVTNDGLGKPGSANITNGKITDAVNGVAIDSGPTAQFGSSGFGLVVKGTTITDATGDGISAQDTALQVAPMAVNTTTTPPTATGPTDLERLGSHGIIATFLGGPACAGSCSDSLDVEWATIKNVSKDGIVASGLGGQTTIISNNTIDGAGTYGIRLTGADSLTLQNNAVSNSGGTYPAIFLNHVTGEFKHAISGNSGTGNGLNAMVFDGIANTVGTDPFSFVIPQITGALGYMLDGGLTVNGDFVSGPGVAKILTGAIKVNGKLTTSGTTFTSMKDGSLGMAACPSVFVASPCSLSSSDYWSGIDVDPTGTTSRFTGGGVQYATTGLTIASGELDVTGALLTNSGSATGYALHATGTGNAVVSCSAIRNNGGGGILVDPASGTSLTTISDSDVFSNGSPAQNLTALPGSASTARVWWGTDGPPATVQHNEDLPQQAPTALNSKAAWASITLTSGNTNKQLDTHGNPIFGRGTITATLVFDRAMDTSINPVSNLVGTDNVPHAFTTGKWMDARTWTGTTVAPVDGTTPNGISGPNTFTATAATSCMPQSEHSRVMSSETSGTTLDFSTPTIAPVVAAAGPDSCSDGSSPTDHSSAANHCGAHTVVFNDLANPAGWSLPTTPPTASETYAFFQWRPDASPYGSTDLKTIADLASGALSPLAVAGVQVLGHDTANVPVSQSVTLPTADTLYDYRLIAVNLNGVSIGPDRKVKTTADAATLDVRSAAPTPTAGDTYPFSVTARDIYGNTVADYAGTVVFGLAPMNTGSVPAATHTFSVFAAPSGTPGDDGTYQTTTILTKAPTQTITATDSIAAISGHLDVAVNPAPASTLMVNGYSSPTTAGDPHSVTVTALDPYNNTATAYSGTVHFTSSDGHAGLPANYTFTTGTGNDNGVHSFTATLKTGGTQSLTATDTVTSTITGTQAGIVVNPAAASSLVVAGYPSAVTAGSANSFTVTA